MKKVLGITLALVMLFAMAVTAFAATDRDATVPVEGYIGLDDNTTDPSTLIDITYTANGVAWMVTDQTGGNVMAATYSIANNSTVVDLEVTLKSFTQTNVVTLPGTLTLNLTDSLREGSIGQNIGYGYTNSAPYTTILTNGTPWSYSFDGNYVGAIPANALQPEYEMELNFAIA